MGVYSQRSEVTSEKPARCRPPRAAGFRRTSRATAGASPGNPEGERDGAARTETVSEVEVLGSIRYEPFDLRLALPDEPLTETRSQSR
jgi:hypothetical protein